jgi:serine/threonine-protein kinase
MGDLQSANDAASAYVRAARACGDSMDLTLGRASVLMGCAALLEALPPAAADRSELDILGRDVLETIWSVLDGYQPIPDCRPLSALGIAHGWAGLLYSTLRWCQVSRTAPPGSMLPRLHELADCGQEIGGAVRWPRHNVHNPNGQDIWVGWCNGSAGYIYLWNVAHAHFRESRFQRLAENAAQHVWSAAGQGGSDLCCGQGGQAYALLNQYRVSGDLAWLERATTLAERAFREGALGRVKPNCLYKGDGGLALLAAELEQPTSTAMPIFESEGWSHE